MLKTIYIAVVVMLEQQLILSFLQFFYVHVNISPICQLWTILSHFCLYLLLKQRIYQNREVVIPAHLQLLTKHGTGHHSAQQW